MKIIVDAMGGDNAPGEIVKGALLALSELENTEIVLVGRGEALLQALSDQGLSDLPRGLEIVHASQVIAMEDDPSASIREKTDSSIVVGLKLLAEGRGAAFVSAGSTGAVLTGATLIIKRIKGIRRAALTPVLPTAKGGALLIDCGANTECTPEYLWQFGHMGSIYVKKALKVVHPRVGLLNIGAEAKKGDAVHREAHALMARHENKAHFNFIGNVEGRDVAFGAADVIVADGFSGNILLKTMEGVGLFFIDALKKVFYTNFLTKLAALFVKKPLKSFKKMLDYTEYGGSPFLGVSKPVIKAHGSSNARALCSAIRQARDFAQSGAIEEIERSIAGIRLPVTEATGEESAQ